MSFEEWFKQKQIEFQKSSSFILDGLMLSLNEQIVIAMKKEGISRSQLADKLNVSKGYISRLLQGKVNLTLKSLVNIGLALNLKAGVDFSQFKVSGSFIKGYKSSTSSRKDKNYSTNIKDILNAVAQDKNQKDPKGNKSENKHFAEAA